MEEKDNYWEQWGAQGERIKAVEDNGDGDDFETIGLWFHLISAAIQFPIEVSYIGETNARVKQGTKLTLLGLKDYEEHEGIIARAKNTHGRFLVPLCDVELLEKEKTNEMIDDYGVWFVNR